MAIKTVPTIKKALSCILKHPKVFVPFLLFSIISYVISSYFSSVAADSLSDILRQEGFIDSLWEGLHALFGIIVRGLIVVLLYVFMFPFFETWTYTCLAPAFKNEPVSLIKACGKGISKYGGVLFISIITALTSVIIGSLLSFVFSFAFVGILSFLSAFHVFGIIAWVGLISLITRVFMVLFIYVKPAYILGGQHVGKSIIDGFKTALKNFVPSLLMYSGCAVIQLFLIIMTFGALVLGSIVPDILFLRGAGMVLYYFLYTVLYAFLTYVYMHTHDL
jgi:hypothetical protein